jgi:hypothetical protein
MALPSLSLPDIPCDNVSGGLLTSSCVGLVQTMAQWDGGTRGKSAAIDAFQSAEMVMGKTELRHMTAERAVWAYHDRCVVPPFLERFS